MIESVEAPRRVRWALRAIAIALVSSVVSIVLVELSPDQSILVGPLRHLWWIGALAAVGCIAAGTAIVIRHRDRLHGMQWFGAIAALVGQLGIVLAAGFAAWLSLAGLVFLEIRIDAMRLPDGRVAHLTRGGFMCSYTVYLSEPGQMYAERSFSISRKSCREGAELVVGPDGEPKISTDAGEMSSNVEPFLIDPFLIDLFPH